MSRAVIVQYAEGIKMNERALKHQHKKQLTISTFFSAILCIKKSKREIP
jgi:hypothetical protein